MECEHKFTNVPVLTRSPEPCCEKCGKTILQAKDEDIQYLKTALQVQKSLTESSKSQTNELLRTLALDDFLIPYDWLAAAKKMRDGINAVNGAYAKYVDVVNDKDSTPNDKALELMQLTLVIASIKEV